MEKMLECNSEMMVKLYTYYAYPLSILSTEKFLGKKKLSLQINKLEEEFEIKVTNSEYQYYNGDISLFSHEYADDVKCQMEFRGRNADNLRVSLNYIQNTQPEEYISYELYESDGVTLLGSAIAFRNNSAIMIQGTEVVQEKICFDKIMMIQTSYDNEKFSLNILVNNVEKNILDIPCDINNIILRSTYYIGENQYYNWLFSNYIQLYGRSVHFSQFLIDYFVSPEKELEIMYTIHPFIEFHFLEKSVLFNGNIDVIYFIKCNINEGIYSEVDLDQQYIRESGFDHSFMHQVLIYGYSDSEEMLYILIIDMSGKPVKTTISYSDFYKALDPDRTLMVFMKYSSPSNTYRVSMKTIKESLEDYMNGKDWNTKYSYMLQKNLYKTEEPRTEGELRRVPNVNGMDLYDFFLEDEMFFNYMMNDRRIFFAIKEHKSIMVERINFLLYRKLIDETKGNALLQMAEEICSDANLLIGLWLKNKISPNAKKLEKVKIIMHRMKENEKKFLESFIAII